MSATTVPFQAPALHPAWVKRLRWFYDFYNWDYCGKALAPPLFEIGASREKLGEWSGAKRCITIAESHILSHPWESVLETLRHEMAHQYVTDVMGLADAPPHGRAFERACELLRTEASSRASAGSLGRLEESSAERDKILARVKELLALAGSPNEHEAANAMRMANKYLLKYNLDLAEIDRRRRFETRYLGRTSARRQQYEYTLASILEKHFFVQIIWVFSYDALADKPGNILEVSGTPENLEIAQYVYDYVMNVTDALWREFKASGMAQGTTQLQYKAGVLEGFWDKLWWQQKKLSQEQGLVWAGDPLLKEYYRHRHPRTTSTSSWGVTRGEGYEAGRRAGSELTIRRGVSGNADNRGRLLDGPQN